MLAEDEGFGDITSNAVVEKGLEISAQIISKDEGILAGMDIIKEVFEEYGVEKIDDIMDNLKGAYEKKGSKKLDLFFDEIGIIPGKIENSAKHYRHTPAHGKTIRLKMARKFSLRAISYRLLLNRSILKSLNFNGPYWDFFSKSYKNLEDPIDKKDFNKVKDIVKFIKDN